jgi:hypothetical protein
MSKLVVITDTNNQSFLFDDGDMTQGIAIESPTVTTANVRKLLSDKETNTLLEVQIAGGTTCTVHRAGQIQYKMYQEFMEEAKFTFMARATVAEFERLVGKL